MVPSTLWVLSTLTHAFKVRELYANSSISAKKKLKKKWALPIGWISSAHSRGQSAWTEQNCLDQNIFGDRKCIVLPVPDNISETFVTPFGANVSSVHSLWPLGSTQKVTTGTTLDWQRLKLSNLYFVGTYAGIKKKYVGNTSNICSS